MKGPFTKRLLFSLGLGAFLGSCQPVQYTAKDEGLTALQHVFSAKQNESLQRTPEDNGTLYSPPVAPMPLGYGISSLASFSPVSASAVLVSSSPSPNPYTALTAKDYQLREQPQSPSSQTPFFLNTPLVFQERSFPQDWQQRYSFLELQDKKPSSRSSLQHLLQDPFSSPFFTSLVHSSLSFYLSPQERRPLEDYASLHQSDSFWMVQDALPRSQNRDEFREQSLPLGKLGRILKKVFLDRDAHPLAQGYREAMRGLASVTDGPAYWLFGPGANSRIDIRAGKNIGMYIKLMSSDGHSLVIGTEQSAGFSGSRHDAGREGDTDAFFYVEHRCRPRKR